MIYNNRYCIDQATRLVEYIIPNKSKEDVILEISGELHRFWRMGQYSVESKITDALHKASIDAPK